MEITQITPAELKAKLESSAPPLLLDVREADEIALVNLGATHIPLGELPSRLDELDENREIVVICHHGVRSAQGAGFLVYQGFQKVTNLAGGIDRWAVDVDPSLPRY